MEETKFLEENDQLNQLSMNILVHAGSARDHLVHSLESLEAKDFTQAKEEVAAARKEIVIAHGLQTDTRGIRRTNSLFYLIMPCARYINDCTKRDFNRRTFDSLIRSF